MWVAGMKVVCVDDQWRPNTGLQPCPLVKGQIYTVSRVVATDFNGIYLHPNRQEFCVELVEVWNPLSHDRGFNAGRFRRVVNKKTDISVFTGMLREKQLVDA